jgi:predicted PurR-regulated permease PerM
MNSPLLLQSPTPNSKRPRPLSYEDLRRFLFLCLAIALAVFIVSKVGDVVMLFVVIAFAAMVLNPLVVWLEKRGVRRGLGVVIVLFSLLGIGVGAGFLIVPPIVSEVTQLYENRIEYTVSIEKQINQTLQKYPQLKQSLPASLRETDKLELNKVIEEFKPNLTSVFQRFGSNASNQVVQTVSMMAKTIFTGVIALLVTAFILANPKPLVAGLLSAVPEQHRDAAGRSFARIETQMLAWIRATLINGLLTGIQTSVLLYFIGIPSAIVFGVLAFFGEFVPNLGPLVMSIPALFVSAGLGPAKFGLVVLAILFVQNVSSNLLVPFIMGKEMELHPVTIVFFALSMSALFGIVGAILAVPLAAISKILIDEFYVKPNSIPTGILEEQADKLVQEREWGEGKL